MGARCHCLEGGSRQSYFHSCSLSCTPDYVWSTTRPLIFDPDRIRRCTRIRSTTPARHASTLTSTPASPSSDLRSTSPLKFEIAWTSQYHWERTSKRPSKAATEITTGESTHFPIQRDTPIFSTTPNRVPNAQVNTEVRTGPELCEQSFTPQHTVLHRRIVHMSQQMIVLARAVNQSNCETTSKPPAQLMETNTVSSRPPQGFLSLQTSSAPEAASKR